MELVLRKHELEIISLDCEEEKSNLSVLNSTIEFDVFDGDINLYSN